MCALCLGMALGASADTLTLKNGQVLEGYFVGGNANGVTFVGQDGTSKTYPLSEVASMSYGPVQSPSPQMPAPPAPPVKGSSSGRDSDPGNHDGHAGHQIGIRRAAIHGNFGGQSGGGRIACGKAWVR